jgi:hypothetical protein
VSDVETSVKITNIERNTNFESLVKNIEEYPAIFQYLVVMNIAIKLFTYNQLNLDINLDEIHGISHADIYGMGFSFKKVETSEKKSMDIGILFRDEKFTMELKIRRGEE